MKVNLINIETEKTSSEELEDNIFGLDPRKDILHRVVTWQTSRKRLGTRKTKNRSEINGSTKKIMRQKGSGSARHRTKKVNLFRGGGTAFGPNVRDHSTKLPKKIRKLGLKTALSYKEKEKKIIIIDNLLLSKISTKEMSKKLKKLKIKSALIIDSNAKKKEKNLEKSIVNICNINFLPVVGMNVYDILKFNNLIISKDALVEVEKRLI